MPVKSEVKEVTPGRTRKTQLSDPVLQQGQQPCRPSFILPPSNFSPQVAVTLDRMFNAYVANFTGGTDPRVIPLAFLDWWVKLAWSPGTHARLTEKAVRKMIRFSLYAVQSMADPGNTPPAVEPLPQDQRFRSPGWQSWPFNLMSQSFLLTQQWWANATTGVPALTKNQKDIVTFVTRQLLDLVSPSNFPHTNPEVIEATFKEGGHESDARSAQLVGRLDAGSRRGRNHRAANSSDRVNRSP